MPTRRRHRPGLITPATAGAPAWSMASPDSLARSPFPVQGTGDPEESVALLESLARLADLRDRGLLTDAEFAAATAYLLP